MRNQIGNKYLRFQPVQMMIKEYKIISYPYGTGLRRTDDTSESK